MVEKHKCIISIFSFPVLSKCPYNTKDLLYSNSFSHVSVSFVKNRPLAALRDLSPDVSPNFHLFS